MTVIYAMKRLSWSTIGIVIVAILSACGKERAPDKGAQRPGKAAPAALVAGTAIAAPRPEAAERAAFLHALGAAAFVKAAGDPVAADAAIARLEEAVALDPTVDLYAADLADAYLQMDTEASIAIAIDLYEEVLSNDPENDALRGRVVIAYQALGNFTNAWAHLERRAAGTKVNVFGTGLQAAVLARLSRDLARGEALLRELLARHGKERVLRLFLADLLEARGDRRGAREALTEATRGLPADDPFTVEARWLAERWRR